jgi:hypothetical protein
VSQRQSINQAARQLESQGRLRRFTGPDGKIVNVLVDHQVPPVPPTIPATPTDQPVRIRSVEVPEDVVKKAVKDHLEAQGFRVAVV